MALKIYSQCRIATMIAGAGPYGLLSSGALVAEDGIIRWVGDSGSLPAEIQHAEKIDLDGATVTPALIDCHTHLVFGGNRAQEFALRLEGVSYEAIARAGGGIASTMHATRAATEDELVAAALPRLDALLAEGAGTVEIKSGYGLSVRDELKMLRVARRLAHLRPVHIAATWLAAHAVPPEYKGRSDDYIDEIVIPGMAAACAEGLVDAVDGFCETIAFSPAQIIRVFEAAEALGLPKKLHAEQLTNLGGAQLAARHQALSADHLEYLDPEGVQAMAASGTTAVLLPGAYYTLGQSHPPPVEALRKAGVSMAVATDANPGTSPLFSLLLAMNMACTLFRLTPEEALRGTTAAAAQALGLQTSRGTLEPGKRADLAVWNVAHPSELAYRMGFNPLAMRIMGGRECS